jgi:hypothetical protein
MFFKKFTLLALIGNAVAKEMAPNGRNAILYRSGQVMAQIMQEKKVNLTLSLFECRWLTAVKATFAKQEIAGAYNSSQYPSIDNIVECKDGLAVAIPGNANYTFRCDNVRLIETDCV